ncbi:helix-turn-helix transcriptional regulator [Streptomyces sp. NPDC029003]|uniref:helix-turn-helix transcriptional regulator n=1 Tax=Streptomyces sp. NPDC029003 TaxID=3155125 RepID=UPI0033CE22C3
MQDHSRQCPGECRARDGSAEGADGVCGAGPTVCRGAVVKGCTRREGAPACLVRTGLLVPPPDDPAVPLSVAPEVARAEPVRPVERLPEERRTRARAVADSSVPVTAICTAAMREHTGWATVIDGAEVIRSTLAHAVRACREELMTVRPGGAGDSDDPDLGIGPGLDLGLGVGIGIGLGVELDEPAEGEGPDGPDRRERPDHAGGRARHRALCPHAERSRPAGLRRIERLTSAGGEVRTLARVLDRLVIIDRTVAYLPGPPGARDQLLEVRQPSVVAFLVQVFEEAWERGSPVDPGAPRTVRPGVADEVQRTVMRLLVAGYTDEAIARRLGTSRRTVAARVSRIATALRSRSRAQLGYLIATSGLLPPPGDEGAGADAGPAGAGRRELA